MGSCSPRHLIPPVIKVDLTHQRAHDLDVELDGSASQSADLLAAQQTSLTQTTSEVVDPH
jgi:hypothetical protein